MMTESKKYILITGVAGLIGARMADWIVENKPEYNIVGIDSLFGGYIENINDKVEFYQRDLAVDKVDDIFEKYNFEYVFHFAAYAAEGLSPFMRKFNYSNNVLSTMEIVNECITHNVKRLIYTSSMSVYGWGIKEYERFTEEDQPKPIDPYAISKYACEMDIQVAGEQHGLDWCIIRPHNVYGIGQNIWDKYRNVLGIWMYQILNNLPISIYGDGEQTRAFSYIEDCLEPFWNAAILESASKQIINVGGIAGHTINEAANILCEITGYDKIEHLEPRHEVKWCVPSFEKSVKVLNYTEKTELKEGLTKMWEWAKKQPNRGRYKWENYEVTKGLYSYWK
jgi:UDP-glucose 4-epimerase